MHCSASSDLIYHNDPDHVLAMSGLEALCIPITSLDIEYLDNTVYKPVSELTDSFLLESANGLFMYESMKRFKLKQADGALADSAHRISSFGLSNLHKGDTIPDSVVAFISELAARNEVDVVIIPVRCTVKHVTNRPDSYRKSSGPGYERPVSYVAKTSFQVQVFSSKGQLLCEQVGRTDSGQPILYSLFKETKPGADVVQFASRFYAPPLLKSLSQSIKIALDMKRL